MKHVMGGLLGQEPACTATFPLLKLPQDLLDMVLDKLLPAEFFMNPLFRLYSCSREARTAVVTWQLKAGGAAASHRVGEHTASLDARDESGRRALEQLVCFPR